MLDFEALALLRANAKREREAAAEHREARQFEAARNCERRALGYEVRADLAEVRAQRDARR